jgi:hypothetical protein
MEDQSGITREGWLALGVGAALAACMLAFPFASYVASYFTVLVHEMGHALTGWAFGYPSIPAFDFVYGGGVTSHTERTLMLAVGVQGALLWLAWLFRRNPPSLVLALGISALYGLLAFTSLHELTITAMGHGMELIIAGVFLHRALGGRACHHGAERVAYSFLGCFVTLTNLRFAYRLMASSFHREVYEEAKGGGHWMDFSVLAEQHLHTSLEIIAASFLVLCLVAPVLAIAGNHFREATAEWIVHLRRV